MFRDRYDAGRRLAAALGDRVGEDLVILGIPRGGVVVAEEVASALSAPLDVVVPRKIGAPRNPELALGAVAPGIQVWDEPLIEALGVGEDYLEREVAAQEAEMERRTRAFRGDRPPLDLAGRTVVLVDDGVATGSTAVAAARWARAGGAEKVILAVPVAPPQTASRLLLEADEVVVLETPQEFRAVGEFYESFSQTSDEEVVAALARSRMERM